MIVFQILNIYVQTQLWSDRIELTSVPNRNKSIDKCIKSQQVIK